MSMFCVLLCNVIPAHHILPAGSVEEVSAAASSSAISLGILSLCSHSERRLSDNVLTSVLVRLFQTFTVAHTVFLCPFLFPSLLPSISHSSLL